MWRSGENASRTRSSNVVEGKMDLTGFKRSLKTQNWRQARKTMIWESKMNQFLAFLVAFLAKSIGVAVSLDLRRAKFSGLQRFWDGVHISRSERAFYGKRFRSRRAFLWYGSVDLEIQITLGTRSWGLAENQERLRYCEFVAGDMTISFFFSSSWKNLWDAFSFPV